MARTQTLVQLTDELVTALDARAARESRSRSELIRAILSEYLRDDRKAATDRQIVAAYTRWPQTDEELALARYNAELLTASEIWEPLNDPRAAGASSDGAATGQSDPGDER